VEEYERCQLVPECLTVGQWNAVNWNVHFVSGKALTQDISPPVLSRFPFPIASYIAFHGSCKNCWGHKIVSTKNKPAWQEQFPFLVDSALKHLIQHKIRKEVSLYKKALEV
jgi:hypothetical protein